MWSIQPIEAMQNRFPEFDQDYLNDVLWNNTAFPFTRPYKTLRQAVRFREWLKQGISVCFRCGDPYIHPSEKVWIEQCCGKCNDSIENTP